MTDATIVGSAAFELRASKDKIPADLEDAKRIILESAKKTEAELGDIVGTGAEKGAKKAAAALKEPQAAGVEAGNAIRESMSKAGEEIGNAVAKGSAKAKAELEQLAQKAREVQQIKLPTPTIPTEATHTLTTNPINGVQSWAPNDLAGPRSVRDPRTAGVTAPELRQTTEAAKEATKAVADIAPAAEVAADGLGKVNTGALKTGVAIGALIGGALIAAKTAYDLGRASLKLASDLSDAASRAGVGTDALQEWRYAARKTGEDANAVSGAIERFAEKLESAAAGLSKNDLKLFKSIGLDQQDLRAFKDTETALDQVVDRIAALKSEADRAAIADKLGLGPLVGALREGADEVDRLRTEAQSLGFVLDAELIRKGAQAQGQLEDLSDVIGIQMASAFLNLSDEVLSFTGWISGALSKLNDFSEALDRFQRKSEALGQANGLRFEGIGHGIGSLVRGDLKGAREGWDQAWGANDAYWRVQRGEGFDDDDPALVRQRMPPEPQRPRAPRRSYNSNLTPPPGPTRQDHSAEREARRAERVQEEINRLKSRELQIAQDDLLTVQQRYDLREQELRLARAGEDADLKSRLARKDLNQSEFDQLTSQNTINRNLEDRIGSDLLGRDLADERLAQERALSDLTADLLSLQSGAARTAGERRRIEIEMLEMAQEQRRKDLKLRAEREQWSPERLAEALGKLDQIDQGERKATNKATMSPLEEWRDRSLNDAKEVEEAYERIAANGLDALNDGIVDAIMNSKSLGDVFKNVANSIIADLARIAVRRGITEPLANMIFGGSGQGSGGSGVASSLFAALKSSLKIPGFSSGIENFGGGLAYVHAGEVLANLPKGTDVIPAHAVQAAGSRAGGQKVFDLRGAVLTADLLRQMNAMVESGEARVRGDLPGLAVNAVRDAQERFAY